HFNVGTALLLTGDREGAIAEFREAVALEPDLWVARHNLGEALLAAEKPAEALDQFAAEAKALATTPDPLYGMAPAPRPPLGARSAGSTTPRATSARRPRRRRASPLRASSWLARWSRSAGPPTRAPRTRPTCAKPPRARNESARPLARRSRASLRKTDAVRSEP